MHSSHSSTCINFSIISSITTLLNEDCQIDCDKNGVYSSKSFTNGMLSFFVCMCAWHIKQEKKSSSQAGSAI
jgi:hypothetical protein